MGLLPGARTVTLVPGDPIPAAVIDEIMDMIIGMKKAPWKRSFFPQMKAGQGTATPWAQSLAFTGATYVGWASAGVSNGQFDIPCEVGDRIVGFAFAAIGNGVADNQTDVYYSSGPGVGGVLLSTNTDINRAAAWGAVTMPAFTPQVVGATGALWFTQSANAVGYTFAVAIAAFDRL